MSPASSAKRILFVDDNSSIYKKTGAIFRDLAKFVDIEQHDAFLADVTTAAGRARVDVDLGRLRNRTAPYGKVFVDAYYQARNDDSPSDRTASLFAGLDVVWALSKLKGACPPIIAYSSLMTRPEVAIPLYQFEQVKARFVARSLLTDREADGTPVLHRVLRGEYDGKLGPPTPDDWRELGAGEGTRIATLIATLRDRDDTWTKVCTGKVSPTHRATTMQAINRAANRYLRALPGTKATGTAAITLVRKVTRLGP